LSSRQEGAQPVQWDLAYLRASATETPMVPNASIDRHGPGGALMGGRAVK
jgi:hypothetical protein